MKIITWNVNGIRAIERKGAWENLLKLDADIYCIQETKAEKEQLKAEQQEPEGFVSYFHSSQERKGYAGTAIYSRVKPQKVVNGIPNHPQLDRHGRIITAFYEGFVLMTGYFPNGKSKTAPLEYKLDFYDAILEYLEELRETGLPVILCGDLNVAHTEIDLARPKENAKTIGFLPIEREWVDQLVEHGWIDVWRKHNPKTTDVYTYWDQKTRARERNVGWRIDYFMVNQKAFKKIKNIETLTDFVGSDHCPILIDIE